MCEMIEVEDGYYINHSYSEIECIKCKHEFCWNCSGGSNVQYGGHEGRYTLCPLCGHNVEE